jgi:uncharacterized protein
MRIFEVGSRKSEVGKDLRTRHLVPSTLYLARGTLHQAPRTRHLAPRTSPMHPAFDQTDHRPFPVPDPPWMMAMRWEHLLFAHWPVQVEDLRPHVPEELEVETFDGSAWIGITPFQMTATRPRLVPSALGLRFPELNVRTYVRSGERPGIWFFSLDAASRLAVRAARVGFFLPYFDARMSLAVRGEAVEFNSHRIEGGASEADLKVTYRPIGDVFHSSPGTLEHFLTERYVLFSMKRDRLFAGDIHHVPWPLQPAEADIHLNTMTAQLGLSLPDREPILHFSRRLEVVAWPLVAEKPA